jgi:hypothetical protein
LVITVIIVSVVPVIKTTVQILLQRPTFDTVAVVRVAVVRVAVVRVVLGPRIP